MDQWLDEIREPARLILAWQAPPDVADRTRWAVGELVKRGESTEFRYFDDAEFDSFNVGRTLASLRDAGYRGYPAFEMTSAQTFPVGALDAFMRRLPSPRREDFDVYLQRFRIRPNRAVSPLSLLAVTGASLATDGFSLIDPLDRGAKRQDVILEVVGTRYYSTANAALAAGVCVDLVPDPSNDHDRHAVKVVGPAGCIGYVNRLQSESVAGWLASRSVEANILRLNGSKQSPRVFLFVAVRPTDWSVAA
ncbi:HIRAN domain-containing protein [Humitalea sp. 24SJ18S-53]|uniref:HIRAN domain-containing protein n=1 Tax=Humitalea sp. 24SJ18S-53 TaxID=3422307 RepID=UPI003D66E27A